MPATYVYCARCGSQTKQDSYTMGWRYVLGEPLCPSCVADFEGWIHPPVSTKLLAGEDGCWADMTLDQLEKAAEELETIWLSRFHENTAVAKEAANADAS